MNTTEIPKLDGQTLVAQHDCLIAIADMIRQCNNRVKDAQESVDKYIHINSFYSKGYYTETLNKWTSISIRLEKYYFKKLCAMTSTTYNQIHNN